MRAAEPAESEKKLGLVRHSISRAPPLALEASDAAAEMRDPGKKEGQEQAWWQNRRVSTAGAQRSMQRSASSSRLHKSPSSNRLQRSKTGLKLDQV